MKSNNVNLNLSNLELWNKEAGYLIRRFQPVLEELNMILYEINGTFTKFKNNDCTIIFQYDTNRYGSGRTMVDIVLEKFGKTYRLSELIQNDKDSGSLNDLLTTGSRNYIPPVEVFKELFIKYLNVFTI